MPTLPATAHLPHDCGVYLMRDAAGGILYIGKAVDLLKRVSQHFDPRRADPRKQALPPLVRSVDYILCESERAALVLEDRLIKRYQPFFNVLGKDNKTYPWIRLTLNEDFPRLFWTRRKRRDGALYFGPYPKVSLVQGLLRYLWRSRIFLLRPCRWDFSLEHPLDERKIKSCLYYHTRQCPAPCAGRISPRDYRKMAEQAALFLGGQFGRLQRGFETEMARSAKGLAYERAAEFRDRIAALQHIKERVGFRQVTEKGLTERLEASRAVTALQMALELERPPVHIEAVDISHLFGKQPVGSFVCFRGGEPNTDHYRKFRVRTVSGIDDFASMR
jgi:excinuclease ABC subunit C